MAVLFEDPAFRTQLLPFTFTRHIGDIRVGILTIREKWQHYLGSSCNCYSQQEYLKNKYPSDTSDLLINASYFPDQSLLPQITSLPQDSILADGDHIIAIRSKNLGTLENSLSLNLKRIQVHGKLSVLRHRWDIFLQNEQQIIADFSLITKGRSSAPIPESVNIMGESRDVFIEDSAYVSAAILNPAGGKIYIGQSATIMEGSLLRGSIALCEHAVIKMGSRIYGASTIGPYSKCAGEISNSVIFGFSNKAHEGYLGNSVIGEWCNLGADTTVSNLKNNYSNIKVWDYESSSYQDSGQQFRGLCMGDHSKSGINSMFNTGTVVGVSANIFGADFPAKYIPSFSWGGASGLTEFRLEEAVNLAATVMARRNIEMSETDRKILEEVFNQTKKNRTT